MELWLQVGWGMRGHCHALAERWDGTAAILSPRDLDPEYLSIFRDRFTARGGSLLLDPQFFDPESDFHRLVAHDHWPDDYDPEEFWEQNGYRNLVAGVVDLNQELGCECYILPGPLLDQVDEQEWFTRQGLIQSEAADRIDDDTELLATVALTPTVLRSAENVHSLLRQSQHWSVAGIYLVAELPPGDTFFASNSDWIANLLDLVAGYRLRGFDVVLGHVNQQMLAAAVAAPTAIASGTKKNVRYFQMDRYYETDGGGGGPRPVWYYAPQALSEYRVSDLVTAQDEGLLEAVAPPPYLDDESFAADLFQESIMRGVLEPTAVEFSAGMSVRHYLDALSAQLHQVTSRHLDETAQRVISLCRSAANLSDELSQVGINARETWSSDDPRQPDPSSATIEAVRHFMNTRGPMVRRMWNDLVN